MTSIGAADTEERVARSASEMGRGRCVLVLLEMCFEVDAMVGVMPSTRGKEGLPTL
jgi:hypothetical protein